MQEVINQKTEEACDGCASAETCFSAEVRDIVQETLQLLPETKRSYWRKRIAHCKTDVAKLDLCRVLVKKTVRRQRKANHEART